MLQHANVQHIDWYKPHGVGVMVTVRTQYCAQNKHHSTFISLPTSIIRYRHKRKKVYQSRHSSLYLLLKSQCACTFRPKEYTVQLTLESQKYVHEVDE